MKNVLVIMGSPRKNGDSSHIASLIEEKMKSLGEVNFKYITLKNTRLEYCRGCLACMIKGEDYCPLKDDALSLRADLLNADGVIFASPVYIHQVSAPLKNFFDRFAFFMHRPAFHSKCSLTICTTEISGLAETSAYLKWIASCWGFFNVHSIGIIADAFKEEGPYRRKAMSEINRAAQDFFVAMQTGKRPAPALDDMRFFNLIRMKVKIHKDKMPRDYHYWEERGWLNAGYFYPARLNPLFVILGKLPVRLIMLVLRLNLGSSLYRRMVGSANTRHAK